MRPPDDSSPSLAHSLFADHLARLERGEPADFDLLCREHPAEAAELRRLKAARDALHGKLLAARPREEDLPSSSLLQRLRQEFGAEVDPGVSLSGRAAARDLAASEAVAHLALGTPRADRYLLEDEIAQGGMGTVLRVWDQDLRRRLAMKLIRARRSGGPAAPDAVDSRTLGRFLEEAHITGQLDHPGIVPVHELGLDAEGRVYFTMKLVEGQTLQAVLEELAEGEGGWTQARVLGLILKVCEAMSYAHARGVIHRDLKPSNVMVGRFGEVYVMDWGLARVLGTADRKDIRLRPPEPLRAEGARGSTESPLVTMEGDVIGTPAYMPPEQARGDVEQLDQRADVYALGTILYQLLAGRVPFVRPGERARWSAVLARVLEGPPVPLRELAPQGPAELIAICEKAMARAAPDRYPDMSALSRDLSAFLDGRVVPAYETGAWAEARKWVQRNKLSATSLFAAVAALVIGLSLSLLLKAQSDANAKLAADKADEAQENLALARRQEAEARTQRDLARAESARRMTLSDVVALLEVEEEAARLWPPHPATIPELEAWLQRARAAVANLPVHRSALAEMRARALPWSPEDRSRDRETHPRARELAAERSDLEELALRLEEDLTDEAQRDVLERLAALESRITDLAADVSSRRTWRFSAREDQWQHDVLARLITSMDRLDSGLLADDALLVEHGWSLPRRLRFARGLEAGFAEGGDLARAWSEALPAIRAAYPGLALEPQMGLLPIGPDPDSGLWEFAHLMSGEPAERSADGALDLTEATGVVLVLLPGGRFWMGSQYGDPSGRNYAPGASDNEGPVHEVELSPFFLSKFEMTQGQWRRVAGVNPSQYLPGSKFFQHYVDELHPVESMDWEDCLEILPRAGLTLPSEAQWEYAARAGTDTPWWTGAERESLQEAHAANLADQTAARMHASWEEIKDWPELDDGFVTHAPIGTYAPNPFGLHEVHGNVYEWCLDGFDATFYEDGPTRDPVAPLPGEGGLVTARGGSFYSTARIARSARRYATPPSAGFTLGVRPARALDP